jgi:hypothetical protein
MQIFKGAMPQDDEFNELLCHPLTLPCRITAQNLGCHIWHCLRYPKSMEHRYAANRYTEKLTKMAAKNNPNARSIGAITGYHNEKEAFQTLIDTFPGQALLLQHRVVTEDITASTEFIQAFERTMTAENLKKILPDGPDTLLALVRKLNDHLGDEYYRMTNSFKEKGRAKCLLNTEHPIKELLDLLPEPYLSYTLKNINKIFATGNENFARTILASEKATAQMQEKAVAYLSQLVNPPDITLASPYEIPQPLSGEALCKVLLFLDEHLQNPAHSVKGLPSKEELAIRTIELQMEAAHENSPYTTALAARDRLEPKISAQTTSRNTLLQILKVTVLANREADAAWGLRWAYNPETFLLIMECLLDMRRHLRKADAVRLKETTFDEMDWCDKPTEAQAFEAVSMFMKNLPWLCKQSEKGEKGGTTWE